MNSITIPITIRPACADDDAGLARLAELDSTDRVPPAPVLLAEVGGELRAALSLHDGSTVADPFHLTADLVALLRARAATSDRRRPRRLRYRLRYA